MSSPVEVASPVGTADVASPAGTFTPTDPPVAVGREAVEGVARALIAQLNATTRTVRRATRGNLVGLVPLAASQAELLRLVVDRPGIRIGEAADALVLAPNTVSTVAKELLALGLVSRERDAADRRVARLHPTSAALDRVGRWQDARATVVAAALRRLGAADVEALLQAAPALARLADAVEAGDAA
ncbi:MAG: MarR family transcriptional regulator [Actinomycetota bacterium]|nr:MAG: MarR family transcriptional regulator [Actinomycetota bacterium]